MNRKVTFGSANLREMEKLKFLLQKNFLKFARKAKKIWIILVWNLSCEM